MVTGNYRTVLNSFQGSFTYLSLTIHNNPRARVQIRLELRDVKSLAQDPTRPGVMTACSSGKHLRPKGH